VHSVLDRQEPRGKWQSTSQGGNLLPHSAV
jgi:hypothetical protein